MHGFAVLVIRDAEHGAIDNAGHAMQHRFDLSGIDVDPAGNDHVLRAVAEIEEPILIEIADIAGRY
jgi:hypothetical protein